MARRLEILMGWSSESRWRTHVIGAARCVTTRDGAVQGLAPQSIIGVQPQAARETRGAADRLIPPAGCIASFIST